MLLEPPVILVLAIAAVLAMVGYLLEDLGRTQERAVAVVVDREHEDAQVQALPREDQGDLDAESEALLSRALDALGPYTYRELPDPDAGDTHVPAWIERALATARLCLTLDEDDQLTIVIRVPGGADLRSCPVNWSCTAAPSGPGFRLAVLFQRVPGPYEARLTLDFDQELDLRHAICLARQDELRLHFVTADAEHGLRYRGARHLEIPAEVRDAMRRLLVDYGHERGDDV